MRRFLTSLATLCVAAVPIAAPASTAQAAVERWSDPANDVSHRMDITRVTVDNGRRLIVTLRHREVRELRGAGSGVYIDVTPGANRGPDYYIESFVGTHYDLYWMDGWEIGGRLGCVDGDYRASYSTRTDTTRFSLARGCLNGASFRATRVRVATVAGENGTRGDWAPGYRRFSPWVRLN